MILVHDDRAETALPEMAGAPAPRMNNAGIAAVHAGQRATKSVCVGRHQDKMHMVWHQTPGPHFDTGSTAVICQEVAVERIIIVAEEGARTTIATLSDMVRKTGDNEAGKPSHAI